MMCANVRLVRKKQLENMPTEKQCSNNSLRNLTFSGVALNIVTANQQLDYKIFY